MITINIITIALLVAMVWQVAIIRKAQNRLYSILNSIHKALDILLQLAKGQDELNHAIAKSLQEICVSLNQTYDMAGQYMTYSSHALQNIAVCMIPFIDEIKEEAIASEDFVRAQECVKLINNLKEFLNAK